MNKLYLLAAGVLFFSCKGSDEKKEEHTTPVPAAQAPAANADLSGCYQMIIGKDSAYMELSMQGDHLSGPLSYRRFEKDNNAGVVQLQLNGDRADGWYVFQSEGKNSVRQIAFLYRNGGFAEGYGDIEMKGDSAVFKFLHNINFEEKHPFIKVPCK